MSEQDYYEDLLGRGPGDPDIHGYPGQDNDDPGSPYQPELIHINGVAYQLSSFGPIYSDGSRKATLRLYEPF